MPLVYALLEEAPKPLCMFALTPHFHIVRQDTTMTEDEDFNDKKRLRAAENLGWLAGSASYTKKRRLIEGETSFAGPAS